MTRPWLAALLALGLALPGVLAAQPADSEDGPPFPTPAEATARGPARPAWCDAALPCRLALRPVRGPGGVTGWRAWRWLAAASVACVDAATADHEVDCALPGAVPSAERIRPVQPPPPRR